MVKKMAVVIDYQNLHLTGAETFLPGRPIHEALIHPHKFAERLAHVKNSKNDGQPEVVVTKVAVFRGVPLASDDPDAVRRNLAQQEAWRSDLVDVTLRPLTYEFAWTDGVKLPIRETRREKGVDVLCALTLVQFSRSGDYDIVVLASRDTDLAPAIDESMQCGTKTECVKWFDPENKNTLGGIRASRPFWTTSLGREDFLACLDTRSYEPPTKPVFPPPPPPRPAGTTRPPADGAPLIPRPAPAQLDGGAEQPADTPPRPKPGPPRTAPAIIRTVPSSQSA